jgi:ribosomal protein S18 acetylase RimI-like enzyme
MISGIVIRRLSQDDIAVYQTIRLESLSTEPDAFASSFAQWACFSDDEWRKRLKEPVLVAFDGDIPIGMMALRLNGAVKMAHRAMLNGVYVRADYRGSGTASMLLAAILSWARDGGIRQIELGVRSDNRAALRFYAREGFRGVGRIPCAYLDDRGAADDILMILQIGPGLLHPLVPVID